MRRAGERVSVVLATFDGERYLAAQLESLARQTWHPDELLVRDDGSTDATLQVVGEFARRAPFPVRVLPGGERLGVAGSFGTLARQAEGDLLFFCDQDDVWHRRKIETVVTHARLRPGQVYAHDLRLCHSRPRRTTPSYVELLAQRRFAPALCFKGCTLAVTRGFVETWGWPDVGSGLSIDFWVALLSTAFGTRVEVGQVLLDHRLHGRNASGWVAEAKDRVFSTPSWSTLDVLVDTVLKGHRLRWTDELLDRLATHGGDQDPELLAAFVESLEANRQRHLRAA